MKQFSVPHYHVLLRQGYDVWTYADDERGALRRQSSSLFEEGERPVIVTCHTDAPCRIYTPDRQGRLQESKIHERIAAARRP